MPRKFFGGPRAFNATATNASGQPPVTRAGLGSMGGNNVRRVPRPVRKRSK